jgi:DNA-binding CsgD family transcriptional regulator
MAGPAGPGALLLERSEELARIESALAAVRGGRGALVVVEGPAGIGKTAVLGAVRDVAAGDGMRVLRASGAELERDFAFGVVRQLFEPPLAEADDAERVDLLDGAAGVAATMLDLPGAGAETGSSELGVDPSFAALHGLYWLSANLAAERPLCLVVDDAHWVDAPSLRFLAFLLTRLEELEIGLLVAARPREPGAAPDLVAAVTSEPDELIRLAPLTRSAVGRLVEAGLGASPEPEFVDACTSATRGTPFLVRGLVDALADAGIAPTAASARQVERIGARSVGRAVRMRLRRLPPSAERLAQAVAVLERSELPQAARLAALDGAEAARAADLLAAAGILERDPVLAFVHPLVRTGVYSELSVGERSASHRGAAEILAEQPGENERVAEHLLSTEPSGDAWVVDRLVDAAHAATRSGAPESAAAYLRRVLAEPPPPDDQPRLLLDLGMAEASAGLDEWPAHLRSAIDAAGDDASAASAATVLALALSRAQRFGDAVEVLDRAAARLEPDDDEVRMVLEASAVGVGMLDAATAPAMARRRVVIREATDTERNAPPEVLAVAAFVAVLGNEPAEVGAELAIRALRAGADRVERPWYSYATWFSQTTMSLVWAERYERVLPLLDDSIAQARATGDSGRLAVGLAHRAWVSLRTGDLGAAECDTRLALAAGELPAPELYRVLNAGILVVSLVDQGELDEAERVLAPLDREAEVGSLTAAVLRCSRGRLRVAQGRVEEGLDDFLAVGALCFTTFVDSPSFLPWRTEAALAELALGDVEAARAHADEELALAHSFGGPRALGVALRVAGVVEAGSHGEELLRDAVESFERAGAPLDRARALTDLGALLRRRNSRKEARELLREALDAASRAGARPLAARAETELRATGARPRSVSLSGLEALTASERRVAQLASQDLTNREIAQQLFITARTVEGHLTSVFRKLRIDSREELSVALAAEPA